jgi:hypothetical protein
MNYRGSYRHLTRNAKAAMLAAIEIYNKPRLEYREECCVILLLNAWELLLKGLLSKNGVSIFYPKRRKEPYRTLSWSDALAKATLPKEVPVLPVRRNLELLSTYRDNAIHFYNKRGFGVVLYALAQTSIVNFKDVLEHAFGVDLGQDITWQLLPLGLKAPIDPIEYMSGKTTGEPKSSSAIRQFLGELQTATKEVQAAGADTGRLLTVFVVKLESTKKIEQADVVVGVTRADQSPGPLAVIKTMDPNVSHPLKQTEIVAKIGTLHGVRFTNHVFQALVWKYGLKDKSEYCWKAHEGYLTRYSNDTITWIQRLTAADVAAAIKDYKERDKPKSA